MLTFDTMHQCWGGFNLEIRRQLSSNTQEKKWTFAKALGFFTSYCSVYARIQCIPIVLFYATTLDKKLSHFPPLSFTELPSISRNYECLCFWVEALCCCEVGGSVPKNPENCTHSQDMSLWSFQTIRGKQTTFLSLSISLLGVWCNPLLHSTGCTVIKSVMF